ncbi:helix-turn-helix domain-containing protein [Actinacidiphila glaucinigra]|uniref:helix-turn-helix domain-containing protein n=1 Tax=Actinacidiphila glaucinigra TaxID=235986 RepID=UPI003406C32D
MSLPRTPQQDRRPGRRSSCARGLWAGSRERHSAHSHTCRAGSAASRRPCHRARPAQRARPRPCAARTTPHPGAARKAPAPPGGKRACGWPCTTRCCAPGPGLRPHLWPGGPARAPVWPCGAKLRLGGLRTRPARGLAGLSQTRLAREAGLTPAAISQFESGAARPSPETASALARILEVPPTLFDEAMTASHDGLFRSLRRTSVTDRRRARAIAHAAHDLAVQAAAVGRSWLVVQTPGADHRSGRHRPISVSVPLKIAVQPV